MNHLFNCANQERKTHILNCTGYDLLVKEIVRSEGCYLYDSDHNRYIDFESGVWCTALGHNHPRINQAMQRQMEQISHLGFRYTHPVVEEAAGMVLEIANLPTGKCLFLSSGSEAVEFAVQIARKLTNKPLLLTFVKSYLAAYGSAGRRSPEDWYFFDWNNCTACPHSEACNPQCPYLQDIPLSLIGGLVFEPGNTSGLVKLPPKGLIRTLEKMIKAQQGLVVVDEVTTGFGRTGTWFGFQHYSLQPDIIAMGKGIGNGYPVSAVVMTESIAKLLEKGQLRYAQSHQNDAWGCAIVKEVVSVLREESLIEQSRNKGVQFLQQLELLKLKHDCIKEVRGRGLMIALEFTCYDPAFLAPIHRELFRRGFLVGYVPAANLLRFYPPLTISEADLSDLLINLDEILKC